MSLETQKKDEGVLYVSDSGWEVRESHPQPGDVIDVSGSHLPVSELFIHTGPGDKSCDFCGGETADYQLQVPESREPIADACHGCVIGCDIVSPE